MANEPIKQSQLSVQADTRGNILSFHAGQATKVQTESGHHYTLRRVIHADDPTALEVPDNVIASRQGDALHLRYADGSTITFDDFYSVCTSDSVCSVNLVSDTETGMTLSAHSAADSSISADDGTVVYAHGEHDVLMSMAQGQADMVSTFTALGDSPVITYLPQTNNVSAVF